MIITERSYVKKRKEEMCFLGGFVQKCTLFRAAKQHIFADIAAIIKILQSAETVRAAGTLILYCFLNLLTIIIK